MSAQHPTIREQLAAALDRIEALEGSQAAGPVTASKPSKSKAAKKAAGEAYVKARRERRVARRELAAAMRKQGIEPRGEAWEAAKAKAGITA